MVPREELNEYLVQAGLEPSGDGTWQVRRGGSPLSVHVRFSENWLCLSIEPRTPLPTDPAARSALHERLLRWNRDLDLAKFCLDQGGEVILTAELPTENLDSSEVADAVDALARCAERHAALTT